ncbi:MAG: hypothetical protein QXP47_00055 [Candidatus Nezhaarchaeales archaeon]
MLDGLRNILLITSIVFRWNREEALKNNVEFLSGRSQSTIWQRCRKIANEQDESMELLKEISKSLPHIEALYMYINKGAFKSQSLEELEARWPSIASKIWSDVENIASKYEPRIFINPLKDRILNIIEREYGDSLLKEVSRRIQSLNSEELMVIIAFSKMWVEGIRVTDEDTISTALEACLDVRGSKAVEVLWRVGIVNRAHRPAILRYIPKIYVPNYVKPLLEAYSQRPLPLRVEVKELLKEALAEDPLKACAAVYGIDQLVDELVQATYGLSLKSIIYKLNIKGLMKAGRTCPLLTAEVEKAWRQILEEMFSNILNAISKAFTSLGYSCRVTYDAHMKLPIAYGYRNGLEIAMIFMPAILPLNQVRSFSPYALKVALTFDLNSPPQETMEILRLSSIVQVIDEEVQIHTNVNPDMLIRLLRAGGFKVNVQV